MAENKPIVHDPEASVALARASGHAEFRSRSAIKRTVAGAVLGSVVLAGGWKAIERVDAKLETPELQQHEDSNGELITLDQNGERWTAVNVPEGGTIYHLLDADREAIQRTLAANGIEDAGDIRPEQPIWVPEAALEATDQ